MRSERAVLGLHGLSAAAVVANEVRQLAQRSAESASAIKQMVANLKDEVASGVARVQQNAAMAEQTSAASLKLLHGAEALNHQVARSQRQEAALAAPPALSRSA